MAGILKLYEITSYKKGKTMAKYGKKSQEKVEKVMKEFNKGALKSGKSNKTVKSRKQAIAIGLSQARKEGAKVPKAPASKTKTAVSKAKSVSAKKSQAKKTSTKKAPKAASAKKTVKKATKSKKK